eukprot:g5265.t1
MGCTEVHPELATGTVSIVYGNFPEFMRSGVAARLHNVSLPSVQSVDYYSQLSSLDDVTKCNVFPMEQNNNNTDEETILKSGRVVKGDLTVADTAGKSSKGVIKFRDVLVKGDVDILYYLNIFCDGYTAFPVKANVTISSCQPGEALNSARECKRCPENYYSIKGQACSQCPPGGNCSETVWEGSSNVTQGVAMPRSLPGYWLHAAPKELVKYDENGYCDFITGPCKPGYKETFVKEKNDATGEWRTVRRCESINPPGEMIYDAETIFNCVEKLKFYPCPMDEIACHPGQNSTSTPRCALGYYGPKCGLCIDNYYKAGDQSCQQCAGFGGKMNARLIYGIFGFAAALISSVLFWAYLQNDDGVAAFKCFAKNCCCLCRRYKMHLIFEKWTQGSHDKAALDRLQNRVDKHTASASQHDSWFRPEKFKIMLTFVQIFSQIKYNYTIRWPSLVGNYMRVWAALNLDLMEVAALDCIYTTNYYIGLATVTLAPIIIIILLILMLNYGRHHFIELLDEHYRRCIHCHEPCHEFLTLDEVFELRERNRRKGSAAAAGGAENLLPPMFVCQQCGTKNTRMKQLQLNGKQLSSWKCYACQYYYLEPDALRDSHGRIMKKQGGRQRRHVDHKEHVTHDMTELERFKGMADMLSKATSTLPYASPTHYECRLDPPSWKSAMMLKRSIRHNVYEIRRRVGVRVFFNKYQNKVYKLLFWVLLLSYPSTSTRTLRVFQCEPIGDHFYLARDYTQRCFEGAWWFWSSWATVCIFLYIVGVPILFFALLYFSSKMHVNEKWEECLRSKSRKMRLIKEAEADAQIAGRFFHHPTNIHEEEEVVKQYLRIANLAHHKVSDRLGFIYDCYNHDAWWWEVVELLRKMVLNGVMCLLLPDSPTQIMVGMIVGFLFMTITLQQQPYKCASDHNLAFACHLQLFITLLGGFVMREEVPYLGTLDVDQTLESEVIGLIVVLSHAGVCAYGFFAIILERFFSDEQRRLKREVFRNESMRKKIISKAHRGFAIARSAAKEEIKRKDATGSRGLANSMHKKLQEDKDRKARLGGFGIHSMVGNGGNSTLDKALNKFETKANKTKVAPAEKAAKEQHDFGAAMQAMKWGGGEAGGNKLSMAAGKAFVASKKRVAPPPSADFSFDEKEGDSSSSSGEEDSHSGSEHESQQHSESESSSDSDLSSSSED